MRQHTESWFGAGHTVYETGSSHCAGYSVLSPSLAESLGWCLDPSRKSLTTPRDMHRMGVSPGMSHFLLLPRGEDWAGPPCPHPPIFPSLLFIIRLFVAQEGSLCLLSTPRLKLAPGRGLPSLRGIAASPEGRWALMSPAALPVVQRSAAQGAPRGLCRLLSLAVRPHSK